MISRFLVTLFVALLPPLAFAQSGFETVMKDGVTVAFISINLLLTLYFVFYRFNRFAVIHGPEILTTVGILGCFVGIALALLHFDASKVSSSVPQLLEGVKTAFWASVSGVFGSLVIRARHHFQKTPIPQSEGAPKSASLDDVVLTIQSLQKSLSGNEEGSLLSQLKLMRQEQGDQLLALRKSFDAFAEKMVEDGSKALIDALREVISDFNAQINEQFGENFKQLNAAVEKLVLWQQQYKDELDKLQGVQKTSADDLKRAADGVSLMVERAQGFTNTASNLEQLLRGLAGQYALIEQSQRSLSAVLIEMKDVTPQFSRKLEELAESMKHGVAKVQSDVSEVVRNFGTQTQSSSAEMKQLLTETLKKSQTEVNDQLMKGLDTVRQSVVSLDKGLQEELTKSLESLGRQLASLSEKFVADYGPLTDRLREVVRIAGQVQ
jgi:ABC-type transporter Mla subunit MlaD